MTRNEKGRSMVEILGVLAIIGVLSVTGIYSYTTAMRKYRANEIAQAASMLVIMAQSANAGDGECLTLSSSGLSTTIGGMTIDIKADPTVNGAVPTVSIQILTDDWFDLCTAISNTVSNSSYQIGPCGQQSVSCSDDD